jgi:membrane-associated phospholipid phosphatase
LARCEAIALATVVAALSFASPASAQTQGSEAPALQMTEADEGPSVNRVFIGTLTNFGRLSTPATAGWLIAATLGAAATHPLDTHATRTLAGSEALHEPLEAGAVVGSTPFALGSAVTTYWIGRALKNGRVARLGADLIQAQVMAETLAFGVKQAVRRARPEGSGFSFPSGHTTVTFASADVIRRTFGWKVGLPAYTVASYVAALRIQGRHHYLSDVVFGAALGTIAGRTVAVSRSRQLAIYPVVSDDRAGVALSFHRAGPPPTRLLPSQR